MYCVLESSLNMYAYMPKIFLRCSVISPDKNSVCAIDYQKINWALV